MRCHRELKSHICVVWLLPARRLRPAAIARRVDLLHVGARRRAARAARAVVAVLSRLPPAGVPARERWFLRDLRKQPDRGRYTGMTSTKTPPPVPPSSKNHKTSA